MTDPAILRQQIAQDILDYAEAAYLAAATKQRERGKPVKSHGEFMKPYKKAAAIARGEKDAHATGAVVSTEAMTEACRTLGECSPDFCGGASEPPTCRFCWRLDIEEPCLLDPIREEAVGA